MSGYLGELVRRLNQTGARHRPWLVLGAATFAAIAISAAVRFDSVRRADELRARTASLAREIETARSWLAAFEPPTPAESSAWRQSAARLAALSRPDPDRLGTARLVAEGAQAAGLGNVRLRFLSADTLEEALPPMAEGTGLALAEWILSVETEGDLPSLARFLEDLPPGLALWRIEVIREGSRARATMRLLRYTLAAQP